MTVIPLQDTQGCCRLVKIVHEKTKPEQLQGVFLGAVVVIGNLSRKQGAVFVEPPVTLTIPDQRELYFTLTTETALLLHG